MLGDIQTRRPPKNFNLLYLQNNEVFFINLNVSLLLGQSYTEIMGNLHLCSRSIIFQPKNIMQPMIRMKYSCGLFLRMLKNIDKKKVFAFCSLKRNQNQLNLQKILSQNPSLILNQVNEQLNNKKNSKYKPLKSSINLSIKLFHPEKIKSQQSQIIEQKILNCFLLKTDKIFLIYRKPISPYITQKTDQNYLFKLNKNNSKNKIILFLKLYDQFIKCTDQDVIFITNAYYLQKLIKAIITSIQQQHTQQVLEQNNNIKKNSQNNHSKIQSIEKLNPQKIISCKRIVLQGIQYGQLIMLQSSIRYIPLVNCPVFQQIQFTFMEIKFITKYRYLQQNIAIQLWLYNYPHSIIFVLQDHACRQKIYNIIKDNSAKMLKLDLKSIQQQWCNGTISNISYINYLNIFANRSTNDLSQYPIFPWIIHHWQNYDLKSAEMFRDLSKPIGAINKHRLRKLKDFYEMQKCDKNCQYPPHLYATHYSTPGYVSYYLIRKIPQFIVKLQNGVFSPSQRIFKCIQSAYYTAMNANADFKELIPEFYSNQCEFLVNSQKLQMGSTPQGDIIDDVGLPKWATSAHDFLLKMRAAFQSDFVSANLNNWIDLIFGFKQTGTPALAADNIFYHLTYQQNMKFDKPLSRIQKTALQVQVSEFGQTPVIIFEQKHPIKKTRIVNLEVNQQANEDQRLIHAKMIAIKDENERLKNQMDRQRYRLLKKLKDKQKILSRTNQQKKNQVEKIKQALSIDNQSLKKFHYKNKFQNENQKEIYMRQLEKLLKQCEKDNQEKNILLQGLKRQINDDNESINSQLGEGVKLEENFFEDIAHK